MNQVITISVKPIKIPGMMPPENKAPTDSDATVARMIMPMDGGIMPPMVALTDVMAAEKAAE